MADYFDEIDAVLTARPPMQEHCKGISQQRPDTAPAQPSRETAYLARLEAGLPQMVADMIEATHLPKSDEK